MNKKLSVILFIIALMVTAASITFTFVGQKNINIAGRVLKVNSSEISSMELYKGDSILAAFEKDSAGKWKVSIPSLEISKNIADRVAIEDLLAFVGRVEKIPAKDIDYAGSGLDQSNKLQFVVHGQGTDSSVYIGGYSKDGLSRYLSSDEDNKLVLSADGELCRVFDRELKSYRSLDIVDFGNNPPNEIIIYPGGGKDKLQMSSSELGWVITSPVSWPADNKAVGRLMRILTMLRAKNVLSEMPKVNKDTPYFELSSGGKKYKIWAFGKAGDEDAVVKLSDREEVYQVSGSIMWEFMRANRDTYRQKVIDLVKDQKIKTLELTDATGRSLRMTSESDSWVADKGFGYQIEKSSADALAQLLAGIVVKSIVSEAGDNLKEFHLDKPQMKISAYDAGGAEIASVDVAAVKLPAPLRGPDMVYARLSGRRQIVELEPFTGGALLQDFNYYRWRVVNYTDFRNILKVEIITPAFTREYWRNTDTQYQMVKPETVILSENGNWNFLSLVRRLSRLTCAGYVPEKNLENIDFGLDQPTLKTILTMRSVTGKKESERQKVTLVVGKSLSIPDLNGGGGMKTYYYAKLKNSKDVFIIDKKLVDELFIEYK